MNLMFGWSKNAILLASLTFLPMMPAKSANLWDTQVGYCVAFQLSAKNSSLTNLAMAKAKRKPDMQEAAREWMGIANRNPARALLLGRTGCRNIGL